MAKNLIPVSWISIWFAITSYGLWIESHIPDLPYFNSVHTDWLNPWKTWCVWSYGSVTSCYGTSYAHFGGPYSIFWYWSMMILYSIPISGTISLFAISNGLTLVIMKRKPLLLIPFCPTTAMILIAFPQNSIVIFLLTLGFFNWKFSFIGAIFKLPIGGPIQLIPFILNKSFPETGNWAVYAILISWFIASFFKSQIKEIFVIPMRELFASLF